MSSNSNAKEQLPVLLVDAAGRSMRRLKYPLTCDAAVGFFETLGIEIIGGARVRVAEVEPGARCDQVAVLAAYWVLVCEAPLAD